MSTDPEYIAKGDRLQAAAAVTRVQALELRLAMAFTFSRVAETEISYGQIDVATVLLQRIQRTTESARTTLETCDFSPERLETIREELAELEKRSVRVEKLLADWQKFRKHN